MELKRFLSFKCNGGLPIFNAFSCKFRKPIQNTESSITMSLGRFCYTESKSTPDIQILFIPSNGYSGYGYFFFLRTRKILYLLYKDESLEISSQITM